LYLGQKEQQDEGYCSLNIVQLIKSWRMRWAGLVKCMEEVRNAYKIIIEKSQRKRPPERLWRRW
jgi:hypothetical protein